MANEVTEKILESFAEKLRRSGAASHETVEELLTEMRSAKKLSPAVIVTLLEKDGQQASGGDP